MSIEHRAAQHKIELAMAHGKPYTYEYEGIPFELPVSERTKQEQRWCDYVLDVGFLTAEGTVIAAVEIFKTHIVDDIKAYGLTKALPWVEVLADDVLREDHGARLTAVNCGSQHVAVTQACSVAARAFKHAAIVVSLLVTDIEDIAVRIAYEAAYWAEKLIRHGCIKKPCKVCRLETGIPVLRESCSYFEESFACLCIRCEFEVYPPSLDRHKCRSCGLFTAVTHGEKCDACVKWGVSVGPTAPSKYAGLTLGQIWNNDKTYVRLLSGRSHDGRGNKPSKVLNKIYRSSSRTLRCAARKIMFRKCYGCFGYSGEWNNGVPKKLCTTCWKKRNTTTGP